MNRTSTTRTAGRLTTRAVTALSSAALAAGLLGAAAAPASATTLDTDRPLLTSSTIDFGLHWTVVAPRDGGHLVWDYTNTVTPDLTGNLYMKNAANDCGWIQMVPVDVYGNVLARIDSPQLKPGNTNKKVQTFVEINSFSSTDIYKVVLHLNVDHGCNGTYTTEATKSYKFGDPD